MKFCTLALAAALLAPKVNSQITMTNGNFTFLGSYESTALGEYLGGGSIVGNKLLIVVEAEYAYSKIASVPILRNQTTGRIIGFDFANASDFYVESYLEQVSQVAKFVGDQYIYTNSDDDNYPFSINFASQNFTDISRIENIPGLSLTDQATGDQFYGCYGVDFSPVITDPGTGIRKIMCTSPYSFWEMGLQPKTNGAANEWEITNVTKLADLTNIEYVGGFSFIPSGSYKGNIFYASWDDDLVKMMKFDTSGRPAGNVTHPEITDFITGIEAPWGFFFDPQTNDFFVSTWNARVDGIVHFGGFVPGLDVEVVAANIKNEMALALSILLGRRRKLRHRHSTDESKPEHLTGLFKGADTRDEANPKALTLTTTTTKAGKAGGGGGGENEEIPTADEIVDELLQLSAEAATETFVTYIDDIFTNESYNVVLSGEDSPVFEENMTKLSAAVELLQDAANNTVDIGEDERAQVQAYLAKVAQLLELLASVVEGKGV